MRTLEAQIGDSGSLVFLTFISFWVSKTRVLVHKYLTCMNVN
jgi:hypothetical protein